MRAIQFLLGVAASIAIGATISYVSTHGGWLTVIPELFK